MRRLRSAAPELFDYSDESAGYGPLRDEIAAYVSRSRAVRCTPEQVTIVNGSAQGIDLCVRLLLEPGDEVAIENPGYHGAHRIFAGYGARLRPARIDENGIVIGELGKKVARGLCHALASIPNRSRDVADTAPGVDRMVPPAQAVLIEDDYDSEYRYSGPPLPVAAGIGHRRGCDLHRHILESNVSVLADRICDRAAQSGASRCAAPSGWPTGRPRSRSKRRWPISSRKVTWSATSAACAGSTASGGMH